jgi:hypothetical protein
MHVLTIQTKFTFGDRVRVDSRTQNRVGSGTIIAITIDNERNIDYTIAMDGDQFLQPGILDDEIALEREC